MTYSDDGAEKLVKDFYTVMVGKICEEEKHFKSQHLKEYSNLSGLKETTKQITTHLKYNQEFIQSMLVGFTETRKCLQQLNKTILDKINSENLKTWVDSSNHHRGKPDNVDLSINNKSIVCLLFSL